MNNGSVEDEEIQLATQIQRLIELMVKLSILQRDHDESLRQIKVVKSLYFKEVFRRFEKIPAADVLSNEWLFDPGQTNFLRWLKSCKKGDGLFYIFGKAGSGKSTLMKFAAEEPRTRNALEHWSGDKMLHTAHYYFWNQGSEMQKSGIGLFQSLLYQILRTTPRLISPTWPDRFYHEKWNMEELKVALKGVLTSTQLETNYCFFIDGLDEYDGDEDDIIQLLGILAASEHIKLCLSSRPGRIYEKELSKPHRNFDIAKFTKEDMKNHAHTELAKSERFRELAKIDPSCGNIISDISEWSNGVWLWVYLVTREIRREVDRGERIDTLRKIVDEFPSDLEKFFDRMIRKIKPRYKEQMAQIFLIAIEELQPLPLYAFALLEQERTEPHFGQYAIKGEIKPFPENEIVLMYEGLKSRLQNRCGDLLVVDSGPHPTCLSHSVDFLHRTVRDFLRDNYHQELRKYLKTEFDPLISLCNISLALLKGSYIKKFREPESIKMVIGLTDELLYYAREAERRNDNAHEMGLQLILDELDRVNTVFASRNGSRGNHWTQARDSPPPIGLDQYKEGGNCNFLALTIQARLVGYVRAKLQANSRCQKKSGRPLLDYALRPYRITPISMPYHSTRDDSSVDIDMITLLLDDGADPNQPVYLYDGETVWGLFLVSIHERDGETSSSSLKQIWFRACQEMIRAGAEPDYKFIRGSGALTVSSIVKRVFSEPQVVELKEEMEKKRLETETAKLQRQSGRCTAM
ncbi:hypothetical protein BS50DRAFT_504460 [Corynespora cassiicola Philippines]|uniref:NACHT domain-containing protein n=1 Tax=Corynespora cassiicola Philippines TaxID=1448308 RepID=A0A2T2N7X8_CORCC|nr:hypothetical protein BS50DRAFT_504460 [Corynespora cassiicola Philippines]